MAQKQKFCSSHFFLFWQMYCSVFLPNIPLKHLNYSFNTSQLDLLPVSSFIIHIWRKLKLLTPVMQTRESVNIHNIYWWFISFVPEPSAPAGKSSDERFVRKHAEDAQQQAAWAWRHQNDAQRLILGTASSEFQKLLKCHALLYRFFGEGVRTFQQSLTQRTSRCERATLRKQHQRSALSRCAGAARLECALMVPLSVKLEVKLIFLRRTGDWEPYENMPKKKKAQTLKYCVIFDKSQY